MTLVRERKEQVASQLYTGARLCSAWLYRARCHLSAFAKAHERPKNEEDEDEVEDDEMKMRIETKTKRRS